jgi:hypothetical protein
MFSLVHRAGGSARAKSASVAGGGMQSFGQRTRRLAAGVKAQEKLHADKPQPGRFLAPRQLDHVL